MDFTAPEFNSVHGVKLLLCFLLNKLDRDVPREQLYEVALDSGVINYFYYSDALNGLLENNSISEELREGVPYIVLEEKGRLGADYFNDSIPYAFRRQLLKTAVYYFARIKRESLADTDIVPVEKGFEVSVAIRDADFDVMRLSLYAPDREQAALIREKIMLDPNGFYRKVIGFALENREEEQEINVR